MIAEIITIGDEILIGQIVDTNSAYISRQLNKIGVSVYQITSVQDDRSQILESLRLAESKADIIIITGGLGPTKDDITKTTIAEYFEDTLIQDDAVLDNIKMLWEKYIKQPLNQINIDQALIPSKAVALMNKYGSAPGMWLEKGKKVFVSLPGVPFEMKALMSTEVIPRLQDKFQCPVILHKTLLTYGMGESMIAERLDSWEDDLPDWVKLAYLPNLGRVRLRLTAKGFDKQEIERVMNQKVKELTAIVKDIFVGFEEEDSIETIVGKRLVELGSTLSLAESCTGGLIAERITSHSGASNFFKGSIVSYATQVKQDVLNIDEEVIQRYSVVSKQVAEAMATQAKKLFSTDYAIATTGNAGPTKGDSDAEVGTVFIALATPYAIIVEGFNFGNNRTKVIHKTANKAFEMLFKEIFKN